MRHETKIKSFLKNKLSTDKAWATRAVLRLYERQTISEQVSGTTKEHNRIGFTGSDAEFLSSIAEQVKSGRVLSDKQMVYVFKKVPKYWRQIWSVIPPEKQEELVVKLA